VLERIVEVHNSKHLINKISDLFSFTDALEGVWRKKEKNSFEMIKNRLISENQ
jgi:hypothetical protein